MSIFSRHFLHVQGYIYSKIYPPGGEIKNSCLRKKNKKRRKEKRKKLKEKGKKGKEKGKRGKKEGKMLK